jgi:CubicO group peptidase (beta-lactamase class C family)
MGKLLVATITSLAITFSVFSQQSNNVEALLKAEMKENGIPGMQVAIIHNGKMVLQRSFGISNIQDSVPVNNQTLFSINSCTKAFTGVAIMQLVEDGQLDITDPVGKYLEGLPIVWQPVTIRQLLTHVSGLPNIVTNDNNGKLIADRQDSAWARVQRMPMEFPTGEQYHYNQTNFVLLGKIIDKLRGKPFAQVFKERQFDPSGMLKTGFGDSRDIITDKAPSYRYYSSLDGTDLGSEKLCNVYEEFSTFRRTASGMNSTAKDLANWIIALQQMKLLKSTTTLGLLWTPGTFNNGSPAPWALGWQINDRAKHPAVYATGGARSAFFIYPEDDLAVIILTNLVLSNPEQFMDAIAGYYIPDLRPAQSIHVLRTELLKKGFKNAVQVISDLKRKDATLQIAEQDLNSWGYRLLRSGKKREALEIFKANATLYPESSNVYDSLAEAYAASGRNSEAIENYERSLKLDPQNSNAAEQLKVLRNK